MANAETITIGQTVIHEGKEKKVRFVAGARFEHGQYFTEIGFEGEQGFVKFHIHDDLPIVK